MTDPDAVEKPVQKSEPEAFVPIPDQLKVMFASYTPVLRHQFDAIRTPQYVKAGVSGFVDAVERWIRESNERQKAGEVGHNG